MAHADDIARLTAISVQMHQRGGLAQRLRLTAYGSDDSIGKLAKACGTTPSVIRAWEDGLAVPTTQEALAWLTALYYPQRQPAPEPAE